AGQRIAIARVVVDDFPADRFVDSGELKRKAAWGRAACRFGRASFGHGQSVAKARARGKRTTFQQESSQEGAPLTPNPCDEPRSGADRVDAGSCCLQAAVRPRVRVSPGITPGTHVGPNAGRADTSRGLRW